MTKTNPVASTSTAAVGESFASRSARHQAAKAELDRTRDIAVERAKAVIAAAQDEHAKTYPALVEMQKAEILAAKVSAQRSAAAKFAPVVASFCQEPSRATAKALASVFQELEVESVRTTGLQLTRQLGHAFASALIQSVPDAVRNFAIADRFNDGAHGCSNAVEVANKALRMTGPAAASVQEDALRALERRVAELAEQSAPRAREDVAAAHFDLLRFSGGAAEAVGAISELEREDRERAAVEACKVAQNHRGWSVLRGLSGITELLSPSSSEPNSAA